MRRRHIFVGGDAADRGLVHPDIVGDILEDERRELGDAVAEKGLLVLDDAFHHFIQRPLPLVQTADEPGGRTYFFRNVVLLFFITGGDAITQHAGEL